MRLIVLPRPLSFVYFSGTEKKIVRVNIQKWWGLLTVARFYYFNFPSMGFFVKKDGGMHDWKMNV